MATAIVTNMPSCPYCGLLFRTGEDYDDHKPCEKMQREESIDDETSQKWRRQEIA